MLRPFLAGAVQQDGHAGQDVAAEDVAVFVREQVAAAERLSQEEHVQVDGLRRRVKGDIQD